MITEKKQNIGTILPILVLLLFTAAIAAHYALEPWGFYRKVSEGEAALRMQVVQTAESYLGCRESDGSHEAIIDLYNSTSRWRRTTLCSIPTAGAPPSSAPYPSALRPDGHHSHGMQL